MVYRQHLRIRYARRRPWGSRGQALAALTIRAQPVEGTGKSNHGESHLVRFQVTRAIATGSSRSRGTACRRSRSPNWLSVMLIHTLRSAVTRDGSTAESRYWGTRGQCGNFGAPVSRSDSGSTATPNVTLARTGTWDERHLHDHLAASNVTLASLMLEANVTLTTIAAIQCHPECHPHDHRSYPMSPRTLPSRPRGRTGRPRSPQERRFPGPLSITPRSDPGSGLLGSAWGLRGSRRRLGWPIASGSPTPPDGGRTRLQGPYCHCGPHTRRRSVLAPRAILAGFGEPLA